MIHHPDLASRVVRRAPRRAIAYRDILSYRARTTRRVRWDGVGRRSAQRMGPGSGCLLSVEIEEGVRVFHLRSPARRGYRQYPRKLEIASRDQFVSEDAIEQL